jgi:hypothetical protein
MELGPQPDVQLTGERPLGIFMALAAYGQIVIDCPSHGRFESFDGVTLEVDFISEIDDMTGEQPKLGVELNGAGVALILDHSVVSSTRSEIAELNQIAPNALDEPGAALSAWVGSVYRELPLPKDERHGGTRSLIDFSCRDA